jgi:4-carboxymuconolactone decarboxylase
MVEDTQRRQRGKDIWTQVTMSPVGDPVGPFAEAALDFVAAEVWSRPGLTRKERRWISLCCAAIGGQSVPIQAHVRAALESGDITAEELREFCLHLAVYAGFPSASYVHSTIDKYVEEGITTLARD